MIADNVSYEILDQSAGSVQLTVTFPLASRLFDGHFRNFPLLPGVVQIHVAVRLFEKVLNTKIQFTGMKAVKFFHPIFPGTKTQLVCQYEPVKSQFHFEYKNETRVFSKGTIAVASG